MGRTEKVRLFVFLVIVISLMSLLVIGRQDSKPSNELGLQDYEVLKPFTVTLGRDTINFPVGGMVTLDAHSNKKYYIKEIKFNFFTKGQVEDMMKQGFVGRVK